MCACVGGVGVGVYIPGVLRESGYIHANSTAETFTMCDTV